VTARELLKQLRPEDVDESRYQVSLGGLSFVSLAVRLRTAHVCALSHSIAATRVGGTYDM
jgi:hypothetical protein